MTRLYVGSGGRDDSSPRATLLGRIGPVSQPSSPRRLILASTIGVLLAACADSTGPDDFGCDAVNTVTLQPGTVVDDPAIVSGGLCLESPDSADVAVVVSITASGLATVAHDVDVLGNGFLPGRDRCRGQTEPGLRRSSGIPRPCRGACASVP